MLTRNNISSIFVLDQDEALTFYTEVLGLEVAEDMNFGPMRWLTVMLPNQPDRAVLLERPGAPSMSDDTASQVRQMISKGAAGGHLLREGHRQPTVALRVVAWRRVRQCQAANHPPSDE